MFSLGGNFHEKDSCGKGSENEVVGVHGEVFWGGVDDFDPCTENALEFVTENMGSFSPDFSALGDTYLDINSSSNLDEPRNEDLPVVPLASLGFLKKYRRGIKRSYVPVFEPEPQRRLSIEDILRLAGEKFIQTSSPEVVLPQQSNKMLSFVGLSPSEVKGVDTVQKLLSAAEELGQGKYNRALEFLDECDGSSSDNGNQMERFVHYFSKALREKIDRETGKDSCQDSMEKQAMQIDENNMKPNPLILALHREIPLYQISLYAGTQAITERVAGANRVHIIDLEIRSGIHTSVLMQALADREECPIELVKVTAVTTKSKWIIEETGKRLTDFAKSINLPFLFNIVIVPDIREQSEALFDIEAGETIAVYALFTLRTLIGRQDELESLMRVLESINPCVMVVAEVEGKLNSPVFVNRFIEVLFYFSAYFDCVEDAMGRDSRLRMQFESIYLGYFIRNMIIAEGDERIFRHVNLDVWRAFFSRFHIKEEEVSSLLLTHASFVAKTFTCGESCTIYKDDKSLIIGWKGMPHQQVSSWRFSDPSSGNN